MSNEFRFYDYEFLFIGLVFVHGRFGAAVKVELESK
jgi:hypothetical protein